MKMVPKTSLAVLSLLSLALHVTNGNETRERIQPDPKYAEDRAHMVLNAIHSAGRLWGSSLYHNGFSFFPATVPAGTLLYHGARQNITPAGPEWLAFDIEHSENFARSFRLDPGRERPIPGPPGKHESGEGKSLLAEEELREELRRRNEHGTMKDKEVLKDAFEGSDGDEPANYRGYLHMYQTTRELNLLLLDGMSAGKTRMGTLDSQDFVLRENKSDNRSMDEWNRALDLCETASEWGFDGYVRMEIGVEIIKCDFSSDLDLVNMMRTEMRDHAQQKKDIAAFQWVRAVGERYDDIGADRLRIDFSSMVSGLFFPINISSTYPERPDLKRLGAATSEELIDIKAYLKNVLCQPRRFTVNWQGVVDLVVGRYSKRMALMAYEPLPSRYFINEVRAAAMTWYDAPPSPDDISLTEERITNRTADAIEECRTHYLRPGLMFKKRWSTEDRLIYTSIDTVLSRICNTLYSVHSHLQTVLAAHPHRGNTNEGDGKYNAELEEAVKDGQAEIRQLMDELGWSSWKKPQACAPDEVSVIAMWPFGTKEDHWYPGCRSIDTVQHPNGTYWDWDLN